MSKIIVGTSSDSTLDCYVLLGFVNHIHVEIVKYKRCRVERWLFCVSSLKISRNSRNKITVIFFTITSTDNIYLYQFDYHGTATQLIRLYITLVKLWWYWQRQVINLWWPSSKFWLEDAFQDQLDISQNLQGGGCRMSLILYELCTTILVKV
jgi:hypothetical protein